MQSLTTEPVLVGSIGAFRIGHTHGLQAVQLLGDILDPPTVDQLVQVQRSPAVGTLRPSLGQPPPNAKVAAQLGAVRTQMRVPQFLHADEAAEHLGQRLQFDTRSWALFRCATRIRHAYLDAALILLPARVTFLPDSCHFGTGLRTRPKGCCLRIMLRVKRVSPCLDSHDNRDRR